MKEHGGALPAHLKSQQQEQQEQRGEVGEGADATTGEAVAGVGAGTEDRVEVDSTETDSLSHEVVSSNTDVLGSLVP